MTQGGHPEDFDEEDTCLLKQAVEKLVRYGQQVGVTPEEMISLLDSGISPAVIEGTRKISVLCLHCSAAPPKLVSVPKVPEKNNVYPGVAYS
jgi:hypothetical protein